MRDFCAFIFLVVHSRMHAVAKQALKFNVYIQPSGYDRPILKSAVGDPITHFTLAPLVSNALKKNLFLALSPLASGAFGLSALLVASIGAETI
jgi:hypothetical protein